MLLVSFFFVLLFTRSFNPFLDILGGDSGIYRYIGKVWAGGGLPYVDAFDHKGPLIFLINAIPFLFTESPWGVIVMQVLFLFPTLLLIQKIALELLPDKTGADWSFCFTFLAYVGLCYDGGNRHESYGLLFDAVAVLLFVKYAARETDDVPGLHSFVLGMLFALHFLSRLNNAVVLLVIMAVVGVRLIVKKRSKNIFSTLLFFVLGFFTACAPFAVYFLANGAFVDFLNGTLIYQISYVQNSADAQDPALFAIYMNRMAVLYIAPCLVCIPAAILTLRKGIRQKQEQLYGSFVLVSFAAGLLYLLTGKRYYAHYFIVLGMPVVFGIMLLVRHFLPKFKNTKKTIICLILVCVVAFLSSWTFMAVKYKEMFSPGKSGSYVCSNQIVEHIPEDCRGDVAAWTSQVEFYHYTGIITPFKHFFWQDSEQNFHENIRKEMIEYFNNTPPAYLVTDANKLPVVDEVRLVVETRYTLIDSNELFDLFVLND